MTSRQPSQHDEARPARAGLAPSVRLAFQSRRGVLRAKLTGTKGPLEFTLSYWRTIAEEVGRQHPHTVLVVDRMEGELLGAAEFHHFLDAMRGTALEDVRIAYVAARGEQMPQVEAVEILAREHGFHFRVFGNENDATLWLHHGEH